jgi:hypothetical protein
MDDDVIDGNAAGQNAAHQPEQQGSNEGTNQSVTQQGQQDTQQSPDKWALTRIGEITRKRREAEQRAQELEAQNADLRAKLAGNSQGQDGSAAPISQRAIEEMAERIADQRMSQRTMQDRVSRIEGQGKAVFPDFEVKMDQFQLVGGIPKPLFEAVSELPNAHEVLYALGSDLALADSVVRLPPMAMAVKVAQLSGEVGKRLASAVKTLPAPIEPIGTRAPGERDPDQMTEDEWFEWRERTARR